MKYRSILVLSDLHFPYCHKDTFKYLKALKRRYKPEIVVIIGDELDYHALSFHDSDADLDSSGVELQKALGYMETLYKIFPEAVVLESNHGSMVYRKAKANGIPRHVLRSYKEVLDAPEGYEWVPKLTLKMSNNELVTFIHGGKKNVLNEAQLRGHSLVQGHHHSQADIRFYSVDNSLHFGMTVGCMIDNKSYAYAYNKNFTLEPIIAHGLIVDGIPRLLPMPLKKNGRWNGKTP